MRRERKLSLFNRLVLWLHYFVMLALLLAVAAKYISPLVFWFPAFFGLAFPHLFALNLLLLIYWLAQFKRAFVFGLIALAIALPTAYRFVQISGPPAKTENKALKVTSYNSMLFDLYDWMKNAETRNQILNSIREINPDILCLQEFYTSEEPGDFNNLDTIKKILKSPFVHVEYTTTLRGFDHWGIATFSKFPIINQGNILFNTTSNNICIFTDIVAGVDTIRVYNLHLQSIAFSKHDTKFYDDVMSENNAVNEVANSRNILRRIKRAFIKRNQQVDMITAHMALCKYRIILCGDFNETAASYAYQKLQNKLSDAFIEKGSGFGITYAGKWPQFRIDYILHDPRLKCNGYTRADETYTDHYPITAHFSNIRWTRPAGSEQIPAGDH